MAVDRGMVALVMLLNAIAAGVMYQRFHDHPSVQMVESRLLEAYHKFLPPQVPDRCGALKWPLYALVSDNVVFPDGVRPGAGEPSFCARERARGSRPSAPGASAASSRPSGCSAASNPATIGLRPPLPPHVGQQLCRVSCYDKSAARGARQAAPVYIQGSKILEVSENTTVDLPHVMNFKDAVISPGVIDVHIHLNEPGREDWEGITTGTQAAAAGGVTTVIDMPLNSFPVTTTIAQLEAKKELAK
ncbi:Allantoinase, partial [Tetrabaena socialis]